jgi:endonuclease YncB( thermonuclease family)
MMIDFVLSLSIIISSSITSVASWFFFKEFYSKKIDKESSKMRSTLNEERSRMRTEHESDVKNRYHTMNNEFYNLTGVSYTDFKGIVTSSSFNDAAYPFRVKARKYVSRLEELNKERMLHLKSKPIVTAASDMMNGELFSKSLSREQALMQEIQICKNKAEESGIMPPVGTSPTPCEIVRIVDGDTFLIKVGDNSFKLRIMGLDTPEVCHPTKGFGHWGIQASAAAEKFISESSTFHVFLDSKSMEQHNLYNDRYGRIIGHLMIDGVLFGHRMISEGHAEVVDFFPIQEDILNMYRRDEFVAKQDNVGMWKEINEYNLHKKVESAREKKYTFQEIVETKRNLDITKEVVRQIFSDLIGTSVIQSSRGGGKIHNASCHHASSMIQPKTLIIDEEWVEKNADKLQPCKICNGDDLVLELIS